MRLQNALNYRQKFIDAVAGSDSEIDLMGAALLIAGAHNRRLDFQAAKDQLARLAEGARFRVRLTGNLADVAQDLCRYLFGNQGFRGNSSDYYNPDNSFLNRVLESKQGIPITLALIYMSVGDALGLKVQGVGFPGHFLVKLIRETTVIIDPFKGCVLSRQECALMLRATGQSSTRLDDWLRAVTKTEIILRMLNNLKSIYMDRQAFADCLSCTEWRLIVDPTNPQDLIDRGMLLEELGRIDHAIDAYEQFLRVVEESSAESGLERSKSDIRTSVREKISQLKSAGSTTLH